MQFRAVWYEKCYETTTVMIWSYIIKFKLNRNRNKGNKMCDIFLSPGGEVGPHASAWHFLEPAFGV